MIKIEYIIGAGLVLLWLRGQKKKASDTQLKDTAASQMGSDWIGTAWGRLSGADLSVPGYGNLAAGPVADPGKLGALSAGIMPGWDGTITGH